MLSAQSPANDVSRRVVSALRSYRHDWRVALLSMLAWSRLAHGRAGEAYVLYRGLYHLQPDNVDWRLGMLSSLLNRGRLVEARRVADGLSAALKEQALPPVVLPLVARLNRRLQFEESRSESRPESHSKSRPESRYESP